MSPIIIDGPHPQAVLEGGTVSFHCEVFAEPQHELDWLYEGEILTNSSNVVIIPIENTLTITNANLSIAGNYSCAVRNIHGSSISTSILEIQG